jgi:hypothetical protein
MSNKSAHPTSAAQAEAIAREDAIERLERFRILFKDPADCGSLQNNRHITADEKKREGKRNYICKEPLPFRRVAKFLLSLFTPFFYFKKKIRGFYS